MVNWLYPNTSRYADTPAVGKGAERCLARRVVPRPEFVLSATPHRVIPGERLDTIAAQLLGDPELWWRIADANPGLDPAELTSTAGRVLRLGISYSAVPVAGAAVARSLHSDQDEDGGGTGD